MGIPRVDRNGTPLEEGNIIAECKLNDIIWDGQAKVIRRPLGLVIGYKNAKPITMMNPEETDFYNVTQIRTGLVELTNKAEDFLRKNANQYGFMELHLSKFDGKFYAWDNIEIIGSVDDFPY